MLAISPFATHSASCLPSHRDGFAARPSRRQNGPRYYGGSDSRRPHTQAMGLSASYALPSRRSVLNHVSRPVVALSVVSAPPVIRGFAMESQARRALPPNQVRYPTDRQFVSNCSPPRLAATQLLSTSGLTTSPRADFHRADKASSRTHDTRFRGYDKAGFPERPALCSLSASLLEMTGTAERHGISWPPLTSMI